MERKLLIAFAGLTVVLALALAGTLSVVTGLVPASTAFAQSLGSGFGFGCSRSGLSLSSMPCLTGGAGTTASAFTPTGIAVTGNVVKDAETAALAYFRQKYNRSDVTAKANDYGCHVQADVYQGSQLIKSLAYDRAGGIVELF